MALENRILSDMWNKTKNKTEMQNKISMGYISR